MLTNQVLQCDDTIYLFVGYIPCNDRMFFCDTAPWNDCCVLTLGMITDSFIFYDSDISYDKTDPEYFNSSKLSHLSDDTAVKCIYSLVEDYEYIFHQIKTNLINHDCNIKVFGNILNRMTLVKYLFESYFI